MKVLITGAGGYLGRGLRIPFEKHGHQLRLMDVVAIDSPHENIKSDVANLEDVRKAAAGMDAMVIAHMAPRSPDSYLAPPVCFDINVKGTANLFHAAVEHGIKHVVVISSTGAVIGHGKEAWGADHPHTAAPKATGLYGLTKALQEIIAEQYSREHGISVSALRVGYIMDQDSLKDKYGREVKEFSPLLTDRRDIGEVARLCLERPDIKYEVFNVMSTDDSIRLYDMKHTCDFLNWKPAYPFASLPKPKPKQNA
jgi:nucleoside-diphosphate-sugar epimerase